ncbi:uncharacterized protein LOC123555342 [Mercenaria mercenaria]|uniref:uncharacterized protein LOC123555342 n=1 Tax=Mercenaria mercenaria TaxID=6596 RepID=UPI00234EF711|nr:uncharacterized protein LOC123555342 [Mercenaria mercenaria]
MQDMYRIEEAGTSLSISLTESDHFSNQSSKEARSLSLWSRMSATGLRSLKIWITLLVIAPDSFYIFEVNFRMVILAYRYCAGWNNHEGICSTRCSISVKTLGNEVRKYNYVCFIGQ